MNPLTLGTAIVKNIFFMRALTRKLGEPVSLTEGACNDLFDSLKADTLMAQKFAFVYHIKAATLKYHVNTDTFLPYKGDLDLNKFFLLIHPDFMEKYIKWGQAVYSYLMQQQHTKLEPLNQCTRITVPLKLIDGKYHWVLQEALPLQIDAANNLISHLNIYSVLKPMQESDKDDMSQRLYNKGLEATEWTKVVWKEFFTLQVFELSEKERQIMALLMIDNRLSNTDIAIRLNRLKNTVDAQNKAILAKARASFPYESFENLRDVVQFLKNLNYFENENKKLP
jgi:DNA-binding CsgD family transcriptional regulator